MSRMRSLLETLVTYRMHNIKMQAKNKCTLPVAEPETRDYAILALSHG